MIYYLLTARLTVCAAIDDALLHVALLDVALLDAVWQITLDLESTLMPHC